MLNIERHSNAGHFYDATTGLTGFDLQTLALMRNADKEAIQQDLRTCGLDMSGEAEPRTLANARGT